MRPLYRLLMTDMVVLIVSAGACVAPSDMLPVVLEQLFMRKCIPILDMLFPDHRRLLEKNGSSQHLFAKIPLPRKTINCGNVVSFHSFPHRCLVIFRCI